MNVILASASPRRRELLASAGVSFVVDPAQVDERPLDGEDARSYVRRMATTKARAVASRRPPGDPRPILAADTTVVVDGEILGKPTDRAEAERFLARLSGRVHQVITAFWLIAGDGRETGEAVTTTVRFKPLRREELTAYLDTGEWRDKAGAYAVQGRAAHIVVAVEGSYTNVVGLPLCEVVDALQRMDRAP
jgi:septum formation protein